MLDFALPTPTALLCLTAILASAYLLNQIFDRESDEKNEKCFYLARGIFQVRTLVIYAAVCFVIASAAFKRVTDLQRLPLVIALLLSLLYSLPPVRLCARPFLDMIANAVGYGGVAFVLGFLTYRHPLADATVQSVPYVLLVGSTFLHTTILDMSGDRAANKISTAVLIGHRATAVLAAVLHGLGVTFSLITGNFLALAITGLSFPVTLFTLHRQSRRASSLLVQVTTLIVTAVAIAFWPSYALLVAPLIVLSRIYYRRRFGITYPGVPKNA